MNMKGVSGYENAIRGVLCILFGFMVLRVESSREFSLLLVVFIWFVRWTGFGIRDRWKHKILIRTGYLINAEFDCFHSQSAMIRDCVCTNLHIIRGTFPRGASGVVANDGRRFDCTPTPVRCVIICSNPITITYSVESCLVRYVHLITEVIIFTSCPLESYELHRSCGARMLLPQQEIFPHRIVPSAYPNEVTKARAFCPKSPMLRGKDLRTVRPRETELFTCIWTTNAIN